MGAKKYQEDMSSEHVLGQDNAGRFNPSLGIAALLEAVEPKGQAKFCTRLAEAYALSEATIERNRLGSAQLPENVQDLIADFIAAFGGRHFKPDSEVATLAFGKYRAELCKRLGVSALPQVRRVPEFLFVGCLMGLLREGSESYMSCKEVFDLLASERA